MATYSSRKAEGGVATSLEYKGYGAGAAKLGTLVNGGMAEGEEMKVTFLRECPCIPVLLDYIQAQAGQQGWIPAIDGRKLIMRRDPTGKVLTHKALNTLLQAAGSIVMKYAMVVLHKDLKLSGADAKQVIFMHDEYQFTCKVEDVDKLRACIDVCVRKAGEIASDENYGWGLDMHCVLASDSMVGFSWVHTH